MADGIFPQTSHVVLIMLLLLLLSHFSRVRLFYGVRLCDPIEGSSPGSAVPGIFQARVQEWVAIAFSLDNKEKQNLSQAPHKLARSMETP